MTRIQLKQKPKRLKLGQKKQIDAYSKAILSMGTDRTEEAALILLLEVHNEQTIMYTPNKWYKFDDCYPPYTKDALVVYAPDDSHEFYHHFSFVFMQHFLMDKYYWGFKDRPSLKKMTHWMIIGKPYNVS